MKGFKKSLQVFLIAALVTRVSADEKFRFERQLMGTRFTIVCYFADRAVAEIAANAAFARAESINQLASDYSPTSELSRITANPINTPIPLSPSLYELFEQSRRVAEMTDGAFDPTLGHLTKLWRVSREQARLPDAESLRSARSTVGWQQFTLDPQSRTLTLHRANMAFDLGGIAKGYSADLMLESLAAAGIKCAMIATGGDIRLGDPPPGQAGWKIAVQTFDLKSADEILVLANAAVSTSGDLHQSVEIDEVQYSHILDPTTGLGLTHKIAATVIADQAKWSDALATAACVLGPDAAARLRNLPGCRDVKIRTLQDPVKHQRLDELSHESPQ